MGDEDTVERELYEVLALLDAHVQNAPDFGDLGGGGVGVLREFTKLSGLTRLRGRARYVRIASTIRRYFLDRRPDGMRLLALPDHIVQKLASLSEKALALTNRRR